MEIISKLIKIETNLPTDNDFIEAKLREMGIEPLRWAIVKCDSRVWKLEGRALLACRAATDRWRLKSLQGKLHRSLKANKTILTISLACENL